MAPSGARKLIGPPDMPRNAELFGATPMDAAETSRDAEEVEKQGVADMPRDAQKVRKRDAAEVSRDAAEMPRHAAEMQPRSPGKQDKAKHASFSHEPDVEVHSCCRRLGLKILLSHSFEHLMGLVIAINFAVVIVETDNNAKDAPQPFWVWWASWGLLGTFILELLLKLFTLRRIFWHDTWNVFDFFVIAIDMVMSGLDVLGINFINVSMLRILRLSRLARAAKVLRVFPELHLMLAGLAGAVQAIFWGTVLLLVVLLVWAVIAVQFIHPLNMTAAEKGLYAGCERCPHAYESTFEAALTFTTQIVCGDSWGRETVPVIQENPLSILFFMGVFVSVGLAILNLILGVVVNVATEARDGLLKEMADEKLLQRLESHNQLLKMCQDMDEDGNDELTFDELRNGFDTNEPFRTTLEQMDIGREDLQIVWTILDSDKSGTITSKEFVSQVYKLKASDQQFMLAYIKFYITEIKDKLRDDLLDLRTRMQANMDTMEEDMEKIEKDVSTVFEAGAIKPAYVEQCDCGNLFMDDSIFCRKCGARRKDLCLSCGNIFHDHAAQFCPTCGAIRQAVEERGREYVQSTVEEIQTIQDMSAFDMLRRRTVTNEAAATEQQPPQQSLANPQPQVIDSDSEPGVPLQQPQFTLQPSAGDTEPLRRNLSEHSYEPVKPIRQYQPTASTQSVFNTNSFDELFHKDSLEELLGKVSMLDVEDKEPKASVPGRGAVDGPQALEHLESVWRQCIESIDDMRDFNTNLASLLESIIRRVSISISQTVTASMKLTSQKARPFQIAFRSTEQQFVPLRQEEEEFRDRRVEVRREVRETQI